MGDIMKITIESHSLSVQQADHLSHILNDYLGIDLSVFIKKNKVVMEDR